MLSAFGLGVLAQSSLLVAGLLVCWVKLPRRVVGVLAGFGAGALLAAISFDLVIEAEELEFWELGLWMLVGVAVFLIGDRVVERRYGSAGKAERWGSWSDPWSTACRSRSSSGSSSPPVFR
jgi:ZIP family zinc transporter